MQRRASERPLHSRLCKFYSTGVCLEAANGIEPMNKGFADLRLTTWLRRLKHLINLDFYLRCTLLGHRHKSSARQLLNDLPDALFNRLGISLNCDVRIDWCFIRI